MGSATSSRFGERPGVYWSVSWPDGGTAFSITGYNEQYDTGYGWEYYQLTATFYVNVSVGGYSGTATITTSGRQSSFSGTAYLNGTPTSSSTITFTVTGTTSTSGKGTFTGTYSVAKATYMTCNSSVTFGNTLELDFSNTSGITNYTHNLYFRVSGSGTNYTIANNVSLSQGQTGLYYYNWATGSNTSLSSLMSSSSELNITIYCATYKSGSLVGTTTAPVKVSAASYTIPLTITVAPYNSNATVNSWGIYLKGYTQLRLTLTATAQSGTTISKYEMSDTAGNTYNSATRPNSYTFTNVITSTGTITVTAKVTDSRGNTGTATTTYIVYDYSSPYFQAIQAYRSNSSSVATNDGTYIRYDATTGISSCNGHNSISSLYVRCKETSATTWLILRSATPYSDTKQYYVGYYCIHDNLLYRCNTAIPSGGEAWNASHWTRTDRVYGLYGDASGTSVDPTKSYIVRFTITDALSVSTTYEKSIPTKGIPFNLGRGGTNAAFGSFATVANSLEVGGNWILILNDSIYGSVLPSSGTTGQIFFKTSS